MKSFLKLLFPTALLLLLASCASRQTPENGTASTATAPRVVKTSRPVFKHSILPGGVVTAGELKERLSSDRIAAKHYAGVQVDKLRPVQLDRDRSVYVSYRKGSSVYWTRKPVRIPAGELILTSGSESVRGRCGNRISETPQLPVAKFEEPPLGELDEVVPPALPGRLTLAGVPSSALPAPLSAMAGHPMVTDPEGSAAAAAESSPFTPHPGSYGWAGPGGFAPIAGGSGSSQTSSQANNPATPPSPTSPDSTPGSGSSSPQEGPSTPSGPTIVIPPVPPPVVIPPGPTPSGPTAPNPPTTPGVPQPPTVTPPVTVIPPGIIVPPPIDPKTPLGPPIDPDNPIDLQPVPEPATWLLLGAGFVILMASARIKATNQRARFRK